MTSTYAADSVDDMTRRHQEVWFCLKAMGRATDEELVREFTELAAEYAYAAQSPSSIRSRRAELVRMGFVRARDEYGVTKSGRKARLWETVGTPQQTLFSK